MPGVYAMIGGAAALTGITRMTGTCTHGFLLTIMIVSLAVIMFEFTGALTYLLVKFFLPDLLKRA